MIPRKRPGVAGNNPFRKCPIVFNIRKKRHVVTKGRHDSDSVRLYKKIERLRNFFLIDTIQEMDEPLLVGANVQDYFNSGCKTMLERVEYFKRKAFSNNVSNEDGIKVFVVYNEKNFCNNGNLFSAYINAMGYEGIINCYVCKCAYGYENEDEIFDDNPPNSYKRCSPPSPPIEEAWCNNSESNGCGLCNVQAPPPHEWNWCIDRLASSILSATGA